MGESHAVGDSVVPQKVQEIVPEGLERALPNSIHDTGVDGRKSNATNPDESVVPKTAQEAVPKKVEEALPEKVHPTN